MADWRAPGRSTVSTFLIVHDARAVMAFAETVFGARPVRPALERADGRVWNAELDIGGSTLMIGEDADARPSFLYIHVPDCDATYARALEAGGAGRHAARGSLLR